MSVVKPKPYYSGQSQQTQTAQWTNQKLKEIHVTDAKCGKMRANEAWLVLFLLLIDWEDGACFAGQSQSEVKQDQSKREITFDSQYWNPL